MASTSSVRKCILPIVAVLLVAIVAAVLLAPKPASGLTGQVVGDRFVIDTQDMTDEVAFVSYENDEGTANLMVVKVDQAITCELDTCNSCNGSPVAYYQPASAGTISCQNCGFQFDLDNLDEAQGGCSPQSIPFKVEGTTVSLATADLDASVPLFDNITRPAA